MPAEAVLLNFNILGRIPFGVFEILNVAYIDNVFSKTTRYPPFPPPPPPLKTLLWGKL